MTSLEEDQAVINYYLRRELFQHAQAYCDAKLKKKLSEPTLIFWRAFTLIKQERATEAIRELEQLQDKRDLVLAFPLAAMYAHENCKLVDREAVDELQAKLTIAASNPNVTERALVLAGLLQMHAGHTDSAREYFRSALKTNGTSASANVCLGWLDLTSGQDSTANKSNMWFDKALDKNPRDAMLGRLTFLKKQRRQLSAAVDVATQMIVFYQSFLPAYIERMYMYLEMALWDQVVEAAQQITAISPDNVDALTLICLNELCREGGAKMAAAYISNIFDAISRTEPRNHVLLYTTARPFVRLANKNPQWVQFLDQCQRLVERAISLKSSTSDYHVELGYILFLQGTRAGSRQGSRARECYKAAATLDAHNVSALEGIIRCQIFSNEFDEAQEQLDIFNELQKSMGHRAEIAYLNAILSWKKHRDSMRRLQFLKEAVELQLQVVNSRPLSPEYYVSVNPTFLIEIVKDYMEHCISDGASDNVVLQPVLRIAQDLLEVICRIVPASTESLYFLAKAKLLLGDKMAAEIALSSCLKLNEANSKAHLLMAEIHMSSELFKPAIASLEMALSYDFEIRHRPLFHLLKARALKLQGSFDEALSVLKTAMTLPAVKDLVKDMGKAAARSAQSAPESDKIPTLTQLASLYLEMVDVYTKQKAVHDSARAMQEALRVFSGTSEEPRIVIAEAEMCLAKGDVENALNMLGTIRPEQPYFLDAKSRMADIFLKYKNDRKSYARCYSEMVERHPTVESCLLLGDAYMNIQEPEQAITVYQSALTSNPEHSVLASKIGKALVKTHDYGRAIAYYETALETGSGIALSLQYDLAELLYKLKRYDEAERVASSALEHPAVEEPSVLAMDIKFNTLIAQIFKAAFKPDKAFNAYMSAREGQLKSLQSDNSSDQNAAKQAIADLCFELSEISHRNLKDTDRAVAFCNEAIQYCPTHKKAAISLAKLCLTKNDLASAQNQLATMLKGDIASDEATLMMADIMFRKGSYQQASFHFRQLLDKNPTHFEALAQYIELARRSANLAEVEPLFAAAEAASKRATMIPGFHFCRGLYLRHMNNINESLKEFVFCRRDAQWGERALHNLIDLFLNPDNNILGGEALDSAAEGNKSKQQDIQGDAELLGILTADKLIKELPQNPKSLRTRIYECHALMATKQKAEIERAISVMMEMLNAERDYIPAIYGTSVGFMLLKQPPRARNQLKRVAKFEWTSEFGDDLEKCWLLLADIYIQGGKYDLATELLKKVIANNKSSGKAFEYLGFIMEKESAYKDAADNYFQAWTLEHESSPAIGFKLAFNYLKAKRYVDAIDVCHKVLKQSPDYPKIEKDILEKARSHLRYP
ncbi:hypothetical protein HK105_202567 [Polyrhizophydium stewartii]|uniref:Tetratricopeptide repeat protein 21B n=1 Tax=Polyrhizophydium stewartii TaxID=2732419 RepID=A0ABR4NDS9_9FUNG